MLGKVYGVEVGGCCRIVEKNGGWRIRGMIEISVKIRTLLNYKFQMLLVKK